MANKPYDNFFLTNEMEDQYNSHLDLQAFCTVDNSLVGTAGMIRKINRYKATDGVEKLAMGVGNTKSIEASFTEEEYTIAMAQGNFAWYDEEMMTDPYMVQTGVRHIGTDMFNVVNKDVYDEFNKATLTTTPDTIDFAAFVDAVAKLDVEQIEGMNLFGFINAEDTASLRKSLGEDLKYVEAFVRTGYIGTVAGVNIYAKKDAVTGTIIIANNQAVTIFNKKGMETEDWRDADKRQNKLFGRKYYVVALTDETKVVKIVKATPEPPTP